MKSVPSILVSVILVLVLGGCASTNAPLSPAFGEAFASNKAAVIVNAEPAEGAPLGDGATSLLAITRYKTDDVKQPSEDGDGGGFAFSGVGGGSQ